jgi:hypothetical protein
MEIKRSLPDPEWPFFLSSVFRLRCLFRFGELFSGEEFFFVA